VQSPGQDPGQVSVGKTSVSKPFEDASLTHQELSKPGVMLSPVGQAREEPDDWAGGSRRIGGVSPTQAFMRNCRNQAIDAKGEAQGQKTTRREYRCDGLGRTGLF
jgi:hypothetical protein